MSLLVTTVSRVPGLILSIPCPFTSLRACDAPGAVPYFAPEVVNGFYEDQAKLDVPGNGFFSFVPLGVRIVFLTCYLTSHLLVHRVLASIS
jgi:hypothetical protein